MKFMTAKKVVRTILCSVTATLCISAFAYADPNVGYNEDELPNELFAAALCGSTPIKNVDSDVYATVSSPEAIPVRANSSDTAKVVTTLDDGYNLTVLGAEYGWVFVQDDNGNKGYIKGEFITFRNGTKPANKPKASALGVAICDYAKKFIGTPYVWGGTNLTSGVDCSGLVYSCYKNFGITLNRTSREMYQQGTPVSRDELQPGDLMFFNTFGNGVSHVGMYVGDGMYIQAADEGVTLTSINREYSVKTYVGARRILK